MNLSECHHNYFRKFLDCASSICRTIICIRCQMLYFSMVVLNRMCTIIWYIEWIEILLFNNLKNIWFLSGWTYRIIYYPKFLSLHYQIWLRSHYANWTYRSIILKSSAAWTYRTNLEYIYSNKLYLKVWLQAYNHIILSFSLFLSFWVVSVKFESIEQ